MSVNLSPALHIVYGFGKSQPSLVDNAAKMMVPSVYEQLTLSSINNVDDPNFADHLNTAMAAINAMSCRVIEDNRAGGLASNLFFRAGTNPEEMQRARQISELYYGQNCDLELLNRFNTQLSLGMLVLGGIVTGNTRLIGTDEHVTEGSLRRKLQNSAQTISTFLWSQVIGGDGLEWFMNDRTRLEIVLSLRTSQSLSKMTGRRLTDNYSIHPTRMTARSAFQVPQAEIESLVGALVQPLPPQGLKRQSELNMQNMIGRLLAGQSLADLRPQPGTPEDLFWKKLAEDTTKSSIREGWVATILSDYISNSKERLLDHSGQPQLPEPMQGEQL